MKLSELKKELETAELNLVIKTHYPSKNQFGREKFNFGTLHIVWNDENGDPFMEFKGCDYQLQKSGVVIWLPTKFGYDSEKKRNISYPTINLVSEENMKRIRDEIKRLFIEYAETHELKWRFVPKVDKAKNSNKRFPPKKPFQKFSRPLSSSFKPNQFVDMPSRTANSSYSSYNGPTFNDRNKDKGDVR